MKIYITIISILVTTQNILQASEKRAPEQGAIMDVIGGIKIFEAIHNGQSPTNWAQISETLNLDKIDQSLENNGFPPLEQNYVFVQQKIPVPEYQMGDIVLMRVAPITINTGITNIEGRYLISRYNGGLRFNVLPENKVLKMLADAGITNLPEPELLIQTASATEVPKVSNHVNEAAQTSIPPVSPKQVVAPQAVEAAAPAVPEQPTNSPAALQAEPSSFVKPLVVALAVIFILGLALLLYRRNRKP